jgi:hypothetical protein
MEHSKLSDLAASFSSKEWKLFLDFVRSPYHNRNEAATLLCEWLQQRSGTQQSLDKKAAFAVLWPDVPYRDAQMNHVMSALLKLGEQFVGQRQMEGDGFMLDYFSLKALAERGLDKHYHYLFDKKQAARRDTPFRGTRYYLEQYWLDNLEGMRRSQQGSNEFNPYVQHTADHLDAFYLAEKLRCTCFMLTSKRLLSLPYQIRLADEISLWLRHNPTALQAPAVQAYYWVFLMLTESEAEAEFRQLRDAFPDLENRLSQSEMEEIYQYAINYCNLQIIQSQRQYLSEALDLYVRGIESGVMLKHGRLSPWHFKNVIKLALRLEKFEWTEQFIHRSTPLLPPDFRDDAFHYNLAELYYYTQRNDQALIHLNRVEFSDLSYHLGSRILLAKIYYETNADDALDSLLHAFGIYLRRNRIISEDIRRTYLNFVVLLRKIIQSTPGQHPELYHKIDRTAPLAAKTWLLKICG